MLTDLRVLHFLGVYPEKTGVYMRTMNLTKLVSSLFSDTTVYTTDAKVEYDGYLEGLHVIQKKRFTGPLDEISYKISGLVSKDFSYKISPEAYKKSENTLFQLECPFFYNELKKKSIKNYILNEHNVYWNTLYFSSYKPLQKIGESLLLKKVQSIEIEALKNARHTIVCSDTDKQILVEKVPEIADKITVIPNCINYQDYIGYEQNPNEDKKKITVLFVGYLTYFPNRDAVEVICKQIAPHLKDVKFQIIGKNPPKIPLPKNVECLGYVDDLKKYIQESDICIAPLRYGSGTRLKILEYMAMSKPVISTSKGAEGIAYTDGQDIIIEDNPDLFPQKITELANDYSKRKFIGNQAQSLIKSRYDWMIYQKLLLDVYGGVINAI